jgi:adenylate cyclase class IV
MIIMQKRMMYEIETRVYFSSHEEAFNTLPFLQDCLKKKTKWETRMYGIELFNSGKILRVSDVKDNDTVRVYLGYKEIDIGKIFNIRNEIDEEITIGVRESYILQLIKGLEKEVNVRNINQILESLGHKQFMSLTGSNLTGQYEKLQIDLKLMACSSLKYPLLLELEKSARTVEEALRKELDLKNFIAEYKLESRVVKKEPPYLLKTVY